MEIKLDYRKTSVTIVILYTLTRINAMMHWKLEQTWTYEFKTVKVTSNNSDLLKFVDMKVDRIDRGIYAVSGSFILNFDIVEGDSTEVEITAYRSENGVKDYHVIPFAVPRQHFYQYLNTFYKDLVMDSLSNCSNLPAFKDKFVPPFEKKTYTLDKCQFSNEEFPQYLPYGFYKVLMRGYGAVEWSMFFISEVQTKSI